LEHASEGGVVRDHRPRDRYRLGARIRNLRGKEISRSWELSGIEIEPMAGCPESWPDPQPGEPSVAMTTTVKREVRKNGFIVDASPSRGESAWLVGLDYTRGDFVEMKIVANLYEAFSEL
jgi:hypothetical protein